MCDCHAKWGEIHKISTFTKFLQKKCKIIYLSICLSVAPLICMLSVCINNRLSVYLSACWSVCLVIRFPPYLSVCLSSCLSVCLISLLSVLLSLYLSICLSVCLSLQDIPHHINICGRLQLLCWFSKHILIIKLKAEMSNYLKYKTRGRVCCRLSLKGPKYCDGIHKKHLLFVDTIFEITRGVNES